MSSSPLSIDAYEKQLAEWLAKGEINEETRKELRESADIVFAALLSAQTKDQILENLGKRFNGQSYDTVVNHFKEIVDSGERDSTHPENEELGFDFEQLIVPPGNKVLLKDISWQMFEKILNNLGEGYAARIAYDKGTLEIKMPLLGHEDDKEIIGDLVKALLEEFDIDFRSVGSTTFKREDMQNGVEPDQCFYIQNEAAIRGKRQIDLTVDPPPDLALEIDNTSDSRLRFNSYQALGVPEVWRYNRQVLQIYLLQDGKYIESAISPNFGELPIVGMIPQYVEQSKTAGRSSTIKAFRTWVRERSQK
jgi:Uma2 family endonuclease